MRDKYLALAAALCMVALVASPSAAEPITFTFSGVGTGTLGGIGFMDAPFQFSLMTDTDGVFQPFPRFPNIIRTQNAPLNFTLDGTSGIFTQPFAVFRNAFGRNSSVGLSPSSGDDLLDITDPSLARYDLKSPFGPLTQSPPDFLNTGEAYGTTAGDLIFTDDQNASVTFEARLGTAVVPEPGAASFVAIVTGATLSLVLRCRTRRKKSASRM